MDVSNSVGSGMDVNGLSRPRQVKSVATARFLGVLPHAPPPNDSGSSSTTSGSTTGDELTEDDVFWTDDLGDRPDRDAPETDGAKQFSASSSSSSTLRHNHRKVSAFGPVESFGILAALPDHDKRSVFNHKASISSASSSRMIPVIPKPAQERMLYRRSSSSLSTASSSKYHQSAPVSVPVMPKGISRTRRPEFDDVDEDDEDEAMLPPHEIVARTLARSHSQMAAYSVLEGAGRTLKGRDLRQVRNAIWMRTGFVD